MTRKGFVNPEEDLRLAYTQVGPGNPSVIVPGASSLWADLDPLADGRALLFYDSRGRGGSDPSPDPWRRWTDFEMADLEAVRRAFGIGKVALIGWSYLGAVAACYALQYPQRVSRLVLMCPISIRHPAPYDDSPELQKTAQSRVDPNGIRRLEEMQKAGLGEQDPAAYCKAYREVYVPRQMAQPDGLKRMRSDPCIYPNEWPETLAGHWKRHFTDESMVRDWRVPLTSMGIPTLVIHGKEDLIPLASSREWAATLPEARLLVIEGAGHYPHLEAPDVFFPAVSTFLDGHWPEGAAIVSLG